MFDDIRLSFAGSGSPSRKKSVFSVNFIPASVHGHRAAITFWVCKIRNRNVGIFREEIEKTPIAILKQKNTNFQFFPHNHSALRVIERLFVQLRNLKRSDVCDLLTARTSEKDVRKQIIFYLFQLSKKYKKNKNCSFFVFNWAVRVILSVFQFSPRAASEKNENKRVEKRDI